jgi:hypothetical protein
MKISYADLEYLYEQKRLETLQQRSRQLTEEIDQVTADLQALQRLRSLDESTAQASPKASGQPWGNYLLLCILLLSILLVLVGGSL